MSDIVGKPAPSSTVEACDGSEALNDNEQDRMVHASARQVPPSGVGPESIPSNLNDSSR